MQIKSTNVEEGEVVYSKLNSVVSQFLSGRIDFLGMIPQDQKLENAVRGQKLVTVETPKAISSRAFEILADNYINNEHEMITIHKGDYTVIYQFYIKKNQLSEEKIW